MSNAIPDKTLQEVEVRCMNSNLTYEEKKKGYNLKIQARMATLAKNEQGIAHQERHSEGMKNEYIILVVRWSQPWTAT
jgi:hypothetical protein